MNLEEVIRFSPFSLIAYVLGSFFLWLGLFIYRTTPNVRSAKLAALAMISVWTYSFSMSAAETSTSMTEYMSWLRYFWFVPFAPVLWLHFSYEARVISSSNNFLNRLISVINKREVMGAAYGLAILFTLAVYSPDLLLRFDDIRLGNSILQLPDGRLAGSSFKLNAGPLYTVFPFYVFLASFGTLLNLLNSWSNLTELKLRYFVQGIWRRKSRGHYWWMTFGGFFFFIGGSTLSFLAWLNWWPIPEPIVTLLLGQGVTAVGIAVLKYNAFNNHISIRSDLLYSLSIGLPVLAFYVGVIGLAQGNFGDIDFSMLCLVTATVLGTHLMADQIRLAIGRAISQAFGWLRSDQVGQLERLYNAAGDVTKKSELDILELGMAEITSRVRHAVRCLNNRRILESGLSDMRIVQDRLRRESECRYVDKVSILSALLIEEIKSLEPQDRSTMSTDSDWRDFIVLYYPYVERAPKTVKEAQKEEYAAIFQQLTTIEKQIVEWLWNQDPSNLRNWRTHACRRIAENIREKERLLYLLMEDGNGRQSMAINA